MDRVVAGGQDRHRHRIAIEDLILQVEVGDQDAGDRPQHPGRGLRADRQLLEDPVLERQDADLERVLCRPCRPCARRAAGSASAGGACDGGQRLHRRRLDGVDRRHGPTAAFGGRGRRRGRGAGGARAALRLVARGERSGRDQDQQTDVTRVLKKGRAHMGMSLTPIALGDQNPSAFEGWPLRSGSRTMLTRCRRSGRAIGDLQLRH